MCLWSTHPISDIYRAHLGHKSFTQESSEALQTSKSPLSRPATKCYQRQPGGFGLLGSSWKANRLGIIRPTKQLKDNSLKVCQKWKRFYDINDYYRPLLPYSHPVDFVDNFRVLPGDLKSRSARLLDSTRMHSMPPKRNVANLRVRNGFCDALR